MAAARRNTEVRQPQDVFEDEMKMLSALSEDRLQQSFADIMARTPTPNLQSGEDAWTERQSISINF